MLCGLSNEQYVIISIVLVSLILLLPRFVEPLAIGISTELWRDEVWLGASSRRLSILKGVRIGFLASTLVTLFRNRLGLPALLEAA